MNGLNISVPDKQRGRYLRVSDKMAQLARGLGGEDFIIDEHTLRLEVVPVATKDRYTVDFYSNPNQDRNLEIKLNRNDLFFASSMCLAITKEDTAAGNYAQYPLYTFPDPNFFSGVSGGVNEWDCLEAIYNGKLSFKTDPVDRLTSFATHHFRYVPERATLQSAFVGLTSDLPPMYGPDDQGRGYYNFEPMLVFDGDHNNSAELVIGENTRTVIAGGVNGAGEAVDTSNVIVILLKGWRVKNGAQKGFRFVNI